MNPQWFKNARFWPNHANITGHFCNKVENGHPLEKNENGYQCRACNEQFTKYDVEGGDLVDKWVWCDLCNEPAIICEYCGHSTCDGGHCEHCGFFKYNRFADLMYHEHAPTKESLPIWQIPRHPKQHRHNTMEVRHIWKEDFNKGREGQLFSSLYLALRNMCRAEDNGWEGVITVGGKVVYDSTCDNQLLIMRSIDERVLNFSSRPNEIVIIDNGDRIFNKLWDHYERCLNPSWWPGGWRDTFIENGAIITIIEPGHHGRSAVKDIEL